ncbi:MAG TPA: SH3 domain-containing protein [Candidatus Udaeobacter sp.]|nr:SH3 domain-containing protein [Candidatus Udaeobacter sp.]
MKKVFLVIISLFVFGQTLTASAYVSVKGYYRSNGTYVAPYVRSEPNGLKYDNYSYTPSQGLYNDSYGTRGTTWDTPTYITDPNYYQGKSLYDSNQSASYGASYSSTPSCPSNSYYDRINDNCKCNYGYLVSGSSCVYGNTYCSNQYSYGSEYDSLSKTCKCSYGYRWNDSATTCVSNSSYCTSKYGYGATYSILQSGCVCQSDYTFDGSQCVLNVAKINVCPTGILTQAGTCISHTQNCINSFGQNTYGVKSTTDNNSSCYCLPGFKWNDSQTSCIVNTAAAPVVESKEYISTKTKISIRKSNSINSEVLDTTSPSIKYEILYKDSAWAQIKFVNDSTGWIQIKYGMITKS